jgi:phenylacetate-CoA ligase
MPGTLLEKVYYQLPIWAQNLAFTLNGIQLRRTRYSQHFYTSLELLRHSEWWSKDQINEYKLHQIRQLVRQAATTVPYYRDTWRAAGVNTSDLNSHDILQSIPILTKQAAREQQRYLLSDQFRSTRLTRLLTSGTTGTPLCVRASRDTQALQWAVAWRHRARFGLNRGDRHLVFGARVAVHASQSRPPFWRHDLATNRVYINAHHFTDAKMPGVLDWLNTQQFDFFAGYPSAMYVLARFIEENGLRLHRRPKYVVTGSDALLPHFQRTLRRIFGVPVTEMWGMAEFAGNMSKCEYGRFHEDFEVCHIETQPIAGASKDIVRLVCTGWGNPAMPFIRYDVGDYARIATDDCPCGRQSQSFVSVDGRTEDYVRTGDGRMVIGMNQVLEYAPGAREIQLYQNRVDELQVRIVPSSGYGLEDEKALMRELRRRLGHHIAIRFVIVDSIPRTGSGKFRAVLSDLVGRSEGERDLTEAVRS